MKCKKAKDLNRESIPQRTTPSMGATEPIQLKCINLPVCLHSRSLTHEILSGRADCCAKGWLPTARSHVTNPPKVWDQEFMSFMETGNSCREGARFRGACKFVTFKRARRKTTACMVGVGIRLMHVMSHCVLRHCLYHSYAMAFKVDVSWTIAFGVCLHKLRSYIMK